MNDNLDTGEASVAGSITRLLERAKQGSESARTDLFQRYYDQLVRVAHRKLADRRVRVHDAEDVVVSAFNSFLRALDNGKYPDLADRNGLWFLLLRIVDNQAKNMVEAEHAQKRGGGVVRGESVFVRNGEIVKPAGLDGEAAETPTPEYVSLVIEKLDQFYARVAQLTDAEEGGLFLNVLIARMQGLPVAEIARENNVTRRQVERKIEMARRILRELEAP